MLMMLRHEERLMLLLMIHNVRSYAIVVVASIDELLVICIDDG